MPTIEELFRSKKLVSGQTAEKQYDVRNTADLQRTPYNVLMRPSFKIAEITRRNLSSRTRETKLEAEVTGLRILANTTSPFLYGTDIIKFSKKSRGIVEDMKGGAGGVASAGILDTFLNKAKQKGKELLSKIGATLPEEQIPSRIVLNKDFKRQGGEYNTMVTLNNIKSQSGGNLLGRFIKDNLQGKPNVNQIIGSALDLGKKKLNNLLLGSPSQAAVNFAKAGGVLYDSISAYGKVMNGAQYLPEDMIDLRNDLSTKYNKYEKPKEPSPFTAAKIVATNYSSIPNIIKNPKSKYSKLINDKRETIEIKRGMSKGADYLNTIVSYNSVDGLKPDDRATDLPTLESYDFIPLKFWSVAKKAAINFRAVISGISETVSPEWDTNKFVGNPFNFYTYNSIERSVNFTFKVFALNEAELIAGWQKINFLTSLAYPQGYAANMLGVIPPFIKFTLGSMYNNKEGFISDLSYEIDDNTPWETATDGRLKNFLLPKIINVTLTIKLVETVGSTYSAAEYELDAQKQVKYNETKDANGKVISKTPVVKVAAYGKRLYGFGSSNPSLVLKEDTSKQLNQDGSPKPKETIAETPNANQSQAPVNPVVEAVKPPVDPKGIPVEEYKGYKIYLKQNLPYFYMESRLGEGPVVHKGPESRSATQDELLNFEKAWINNEAGATSAFKEVGKSITDKLNNQSILLGGY
jgi:hypothetical protein